MRGLRQEQAVATAAYGREIYGNEHVSVKFERLRKPKEWFLREHDLKARVEVTVQAFSMIPPLVSGTDRIATMPSRLVKHFEQTFPLQIIELPLQLPTFPEAVQWPTLHNNDPASIWMREIMLQEASRMATPRKTQERHARF